MLEGQFSDKELLRQYVKEKGLSRHGFARVLGFSRSFLDGDGSITVENLRKILTHPDFADLNLDAFLQQKTELVKEKGVLSESLASHSFLVDAVKLISDLKNSKENISPEVHKLLDYFDQAIQLLSTLSEDYQKIYRDYHNLYKSIAREL